MNYVGGCPHTFANAFMSLLKYLLLIFWFNEKLYEGC